MKPEQFAALKADFEEAVKGKTLYVQDLYVGADKDYRVPIRIVTEYAWHSLFAREPCSSDHETPPSEPVYTVIDLPSFRADPERQRFPHRHGGRGKPERAVGLGRQHRVRGRDQKIHFFRR